MTTMKKHTDSFYVTGGTLRRDADCYVQRGADQALYDGLMQGKFCYVLTSRQMGKSSLMVRTAARLREEGVHVAVLDLTAIGQNLTAEQWYDGLLARLGQQLHLEDELEDVWLTNPRSGVLLRWMQAIRTVVLPRLAGRIVIFVDEIDAVRSLPFSTDEFFAAIRELYNRRTEDPELERLTFCLLGVATPSDLIRDTRTTPFNIGQRIELNDFTDDEAAPLARGLGREDKLATKLLKRILYWTGGHPYLTQRLCQAVAADASVHDAGGVDRLCEELFFTTRARERDDNLLFVRERLLKSEADRAAVLDLYKKLRDNQRVKDDETNPLISVLRLSGITRVVEGLLYVRNRIYYRVFDREWVLANLPDAEVQRQKAAYRRGVMRTATIAAVMLAVVSGLALLAYWQRNQAKQQAEENRKLLYTAQINLAAQDWEDNSFARIRGLLNRYIPSNGQEDHRGFEWFYLWRLSHSDLQTINHSGAFNLTFSKDTKLMATGESQSPTITIWETATQQKLRTLSGPEQENAHLFFSSDGKTFVVSGDKMLKFWDVNTGQEIRTMDTQEHPVYDLSFSPDGKSLAMAGKGGKVSFWDLQSWQETSSIQTGKDGKFWISYSPDGKHLVMGHNDGSPKIWDLRTGKQSQIINLPPQYLSHSFSPDGKRIAVSGADTGLKIWEVESGKESLTILNPKDNKKMFLDVTFSPDGKRLAAAGNDSSIKVWEALTGQELFTFKGTSSQAAVLRFTPDAKKLISVSFGPEIKVWDVSTEAEVTVLDAQTESVSAAFSPDGKTFATGGRDGVIKLWDAVSGKELFALKNHNKAIRSVSFSADGRRLVSTTMVETMVETTRVTNWDLATRKELHSDQSTPTKTFGPLGEIWNGDRYVVWEKEKMLIKVKDVNSGKELFTVPGEAQSGTAFSGDGKTLAVSATFGDVKLFDIASGKEVMTLQEARSLWNWAAAFSPNGEKLAWGTDTGQVTVWNLKTGQKIFSTQAYGKRTMALVFSPDGKRLFSAGGNRLKIWDANTGEELLTLSGHTETIIGLAISPDGKTLVSTGFDKTIRLWRAATDAEVQARRGQ